MGEPLTSTLLVEHGDCVVPILLTVTSKLAYHVGPASADRSDGYNLYVFHLFLFHSDRKLAQEVLKKLPGGGTFHSDRIWAHGEPWGPHSRSFI